MALHPTFGHFKPDCEQASWWKEIYGSHDVPLKSGLPHKATVPNHDDPQDCYLIDVKRLSPEQIEKICRTMATKFNVPIEEVREGVLGEHGVPVLAKNLSGVSFDARLFL